MQKKLSGIVSSVKKHIELEALAGTGEWLGAAPSMGTPAPSGSLEDLKKKALVCDRCDLQETRTRVVFGAGDQRARLMFVGEAPGMEEDRQGLPFVGRAGQLLTKIIGSIGLGREEVYIANILKCRPPNNRNPLPTEILECENYLLKQIELIRPVVICALGKFAAQTLLKSVEPISRLRGRFFDYHGSRLIPTFHPAYLLRNPSEKRAVWEDMKLIKKELNQKKNA